MHKRAATLSVACMFAWVFSGCMKHAPLPTAQDGSPGSDPSISEYIRTVLRISSENSPVIDQALSELHKRRPELADLAQHVANDPEDRQAIRTLAQAYFQEKLYLKAYDLYQQVQFAAPEDPQVCLGLAQIWEVWGDKDLALLYATRAVALDPGSWEALAVSGRIRLQRRELDGALAAFLASLQVSPDNSSVQASTGYIYMLRDDWESARKHLQRAVDLDGTVPETRNNLGVVLARLGDPEGALGAFMVTENPAVAHNNLGATYLALRDWEGAQVQFRQALAINPEYAKAALNLKEAESHLPLPAVYEVQPFPAAMPGLKEVDWQRPAETAHSRLQPTVPVSLSDYIRSVFQLQESIAGSGQVAAFPSPKSDDTASVFSRYAQIPAHAIGKVLPAEGEGNTPTTSLPREEYAPGASTIRQAPAASRNLPEPSQKLSKPVAPATPATGDLPSGGGRSSSKTSGKRLIPAQRSRMAVLMAAHQQFRPMARISLSDYIRKVFQLQQDASRIGELAGRAPRATEFRATMHGTMSSASPALERKVAAKIFASYEQVRTDAVIAPSISEGGKFAGPSRAVPYAIESDPALRLAIRLEPTNIEKNPRLIVPAAQKADIVNPWALARTGQRLLKQGQWERAREVLEQATRVDASVPGARENLGVALAHLGDREGALRIFLTLGRPAEAFYRLGLIYLSEKKWPEARNEFKRALSLEPDFSESRAELREAEFRLGSSPGLAAPVLAVKNERNTGAVGEKLIQRPGPVAVIEGAHLEDRGFGATLHTAKRLLLDGLIRNYWMVPTDDWNKRMGAE